MAEIKYLGLDISTSIIGICFLDSNYNLVNLQAINLKKIKCMFQKSLVVKNEFSKIKSNYNISESLEISIEEAFQSFSKGFSSAKTLSQLNRFNGIVSYLTYEAFGKTPKYINVNSARKNLDIKIDRKSDKNTKEQIFEWVQKEINFDWPTKTLKSGPNKGLVKNDESCYDMSDAYVICRALKYNDKSNN